MRKVSSVEVENPPTQKERLGQLQEQLKAVIDLVNEQAGQEHLPAFMQFEQGLTAQLEAVGRAASELFLTQAEQRVAAAGQQGVQIRDRFFRPTIVPQPRNLKGKYGVIRYFRSYMRENRAARRRGFHPLDVALGLSTDRFSWNVLSLSARLATKMSYVDAHETLGLFLPYAPSTEVIEQTILGLGRHTAEWFESLPAPEGDGEVLIVMIDSKGAPTATAEELRRRRGKRRKRSPSPSPRHRGRNHRGRYPSKPRREKGDKSKNAKMATMVVMYTLQRRGSLLLGPINRMVYASFAPKEHAFQIARRESDKRGFTPGSGRLIQVVTDGDLDLDLYTRRYFPEAIHTIDVMHVLEKLWVAGECLYPEGSADLKRWVHQQKKRLYGDKTHLIINELRQRYETTPATGPGNKGKRKRLWNVLCYIEKRVDRMNYKQLLAQDLEIGSGAVEGAIKNIIGKRCDHGGMRWIKERVEALVQLRCIEINGHWTEFIGRVHNRFQADAQATGDRFRLQSSAAAPLPVVSPPAKAA